jgi:hypothetical protein
LCFTSEDESLWVEDPVEYVHAKIGTVNTSASKLGDLF